MLNRLEILILYRENYDLAVEEGFGESSAEIAWERTRERLLRLFDRLKDQIYWQQVEGVNKAFFG